MTMEKCKKCKGSGKVPVANPGNCDPLYETCPDCNGTGLAEQPKEDE